MKYLMRVSTIAVLVVVGLHCSLAVGQFVHNVGLIVDQMPQVDGGFIYRLATFPQLPTYYAAGPDGSVYSSTNRSKDFNSFADLASGLFGDWTNTEVPFPGFPGTTNTYSFRVAPFTLQDVVTETPVVTSPIDGAIVPRNFSVSWAFPQGSNPPLHSASIYNDAHFIDVVSVLDGPVGDYSVIVETAPRIAGAIPVPIVVDGGVNLPAPIITDRSPGLDGQLIFASLRYNSDSFPVTFLVVPEPSTFLSLLLAGSVIVCGRPRRSR